MEDIKMPQNAEEYLQMTIDRGNTDGWYLVGKLEWPRVDWETGRPITQEYNEMPTGYFGNEDYLWVQSIVRDTYEHPEGKWEIGVPAVKTGKQHREYRWCLGIPPNGNVTYRYTPWTVMDILQYLANRGVVAIGRTTDRGTPVMHVPDRVRLQGMTEWVTMQQ